MANEFKIKNGLYVSGSVTITNNITVSGSLDIVGGITGSLSGSAISASHALDSDTLGGLPSSSFAPATTFNDVSSSYASASGSLSTRVTNLESTASVLTSASASFAVVSSSYASASGSLSTRVTNLEATSSTVSSSFASTSGSIAGRVTTIESKYATTGSNTFTGAQRITDVSNAIGFASTASLYTDGGLRVTKDSFVSGTAYFNNVVVYGTSSIEYITSSQLAIGTNIITLNTDTPAIRYGGISVFDSGSNNQSTGSLFWDSEKDKWIYSNPSGSTYDGGMLISGPRNTSGLGNEVGTTSCAVMIGQGGDHITSSGIFSYANATCFYGTSLISGSGNACFSGQVCSATIVSAGSIQGTTLYGSTAICGGAVSGTTAAFSGQISQTLGDNQILYTNTSATTGYQYMRMVSTGAQLTWGIDANPSAGLLTNSLANSAVIGNSKNAPFHIGTNAIVRFTVDCNGVSTFTCQVCAPAFVGGTVSGTTGTFSSCVTATQLFINGNGNEVVLTSTDVNGQYINFATCACSYGYIGNAYHVMSAPSNVNTDLAIRAQTNLIFSAGGSVERFRIAANGVACFACDLTAKTLGTNDLILNNLNYECANYVDGTRGSWLIQEGACDLFIINQVSGKKYKFNLIEIK